MSENDVFRGVGVEILLNEPDDFLKVKETLTRIGVPNRKNKILYQSCHILHKRGRYAILHFKELFKLDGKPSNIDEDDVARRNKIAIMLADWGLVKIAHPEQLTETEPKTPIKIISYREKPEWNLVTKYNIGTYKK